MNYWTWTCPYCVPDSGGNHNWTCPNHPNNSEHGGSPSYGFSWNWDMDEKKRTAKLETENARLKGFLKTIFVKAQANAAPLLLAEIAGNALGGEKCEELRENARLREQLAEWKKGYDIISEAHIDALRTANTTKEQLAQARRDYLRLEAWAQIATEIVRREWDDLDGSFMTWAALADWQKRRLR